MNTDIYFAYLFHPVGQGLFCTGTLLPDHHSQAPFHWTFDCGSMAKEADWISQVSWYRDLVLQDDILNLLCISHFDHDHVSGLAELLHGRHVDTVVIPYYTPIERLVLAATQDRRRGQDDSEYHEFLSNPSAFLIERAASIQQIIVVHHFSPDTDNPQWPIESNPDPNSPIRGLTERPLNSNYRRQDYRRALDRELWRVNVWDPPPSSDTHPLPAGLRDSLSPWHGGLSFVGDNCHLKALASTHGPDIYPQWEFLFFHKPVSSEITPDLIRNIDNILHKHRMSSDQRTDLAGCLQNKSIRNQIRDAYRRSFPGSKRFNTAGLSTYAGPIEDRLELTAISAPHIWHGIPSLRPANGTSIQWILGPHWRGPRWCPGILYTGDTDFHPVQHRDEIRQFLGPNRWEAIYILQVPHHGSANNWQVGAANEFCHQWSVFSADPQYKLHHPDQSVLLDLLNKNPLLVDRVAGVAWSGICHFEEP